MIAENALISKIILQAITDLKHPDTPKKWKRDAEQFLKSQDCFVICSYIGIKKENYLEWIRKNA